MEWKILVVDDEAAIADLVEAYLTGEGWTVYKAGTAAEALALAAAVGPDLAILDVMLPDMDGLTLCRKLREAYAWPIIMLTAKDGEADTIAGLTLGADDYVTKPFRPLELTARVKSQLRRYKRYGQGAGGPASPDVLTHGELVLDRRAHTCVLGDRALELTPTEFSILRILLENRGSVVSSEALFHQIWKDEYYSKSNNTITVHIRHLREKLEDSTDKPKYIKTVWGVGYKIEAKG